jgi:TonB-linked SusC/RagA family outer membrane protein
MRKKLYCHAVRLCTAFIFLLFSSSLFAQKAVTGTVFSSKDNAPVNGATVLVKGTNTGVTTGANGNFSINVPSGRNTLVISYIGFHDQEVDVSSNNNVTVTLQENAAALDEIVVTGYTAQKKKDITGAVSVVNVTSMKSVPAGTSESLLQGQAAGVTVINSGAPGGYSNVRIRGISSLGSSDPLVIIDGVQGSLHDLNPNDIESVQILKDAGSAAIYGIQGSNGVIVVTTKKGSGKSKITYTGYVGTQRPLENGFDVANTQGYADAIWRQAVGSGVAPKHPQFGNGAEPVIPDYITPAGAKEGDPKTDPSTYVFDPGQKDDNRITKASKAGTDWFHEIFKPAMIQSHTLSASGSNEKSAYFFSLNYFNQQGTLINTYLKRYSARINTTFNVKEHIRFGENAYLVYRQNPGFPGGNQNEGNAISYSYREPAIIPVYDIMGNYAGTGSSGLGNSNNPVALQQRQANNKSNDWQINGNAFAEADFAKHFTIRTSFGGTVENNYSYSFTYTGYENAEGNTSSNGFTERAGYNSLWQWTNTLNYNNQFGDHSLKVLLGTEAKNIYNRSMSGNRGNYYTTDPNYWILNNGAPSTQTNNGASPTQTSLFSVFGRVDYNYKDKYLITGVVRRDGASVFAPDHRYGTFPSVTAGWRISQESFMKGVTFINDLKIRGGYGQLGSISNISPTNPYTLYNSGPGYSYYPIAGNSVSPTQGFFVSQFGNTNTTWEKDAITNIGLDATILNRKLDFSIEWYKKAVSDLLFRATSQIGAYVGGATLPFVNFGDIKNTGIDFSATYHANVSKDLRLDLTGTLTSYKSEVVSLPPGYKYIDQNSNGSTRIGAFTRTQPGQPIGEFFGYQVIGLFQDQADVSKSPKQDAAAPGRFKYADVNGDGQITPDDRTFFGNPNPKFTYGLNLALTYKSFDFSAFFYGSEGNKNINYVKYWLDFPQVFGDVSNNVLNNSAKLINTQTNQPTSTKDPLAKVSNPGATVPVLEQDANFSNTSVFNSYYMENGSFLKCRQMQIGYTIPVATLHRFGIDRCRFYLQAANLFTITKYSGLDPELQTSSSTNNSNFGIDFGNYPANQKMYNIGVDLSF